MDIPSLVTASTSVREVAQAAYAAATGKSLGSDDATSPGKKKKKKTKVGPNGRPGSGKRVFVVPKTKKPWQQAANSILSKDKLNAPASPPRQMARTGNGGYGSPQGGNGNTGQPEQGDKYGPVGTPSFSGRTSPDRKFRVPPMNKPWSTDRYGGASGGGSSNYPVSPSYSQEHDEHIHRAYSQSAEEKEAEEEEDVRAQVVEFARRIFNDADADDSGSCSKSEIKKYFKKNPEEKELLAGDNFTWSAFWLKVDTDGDGDITEVEFVAACVTVYEEAVLATRQAQVDAYLDEVTMEVEREASDEPEVPLAAPAPARTPASTTTSTSTTKAAPPPRQEEDEAAEEEEEETTEEAAARQRRQTFEELSQAGAAGFTARQQLFKEIDADADGTVTLKEALAAIALRFEDFDNLSACMMAFNAADRDGNGLGWRETRLFFQYQLFYDDAWEFFQLVDSDGNGAISREEFAELDSAILGIASDRASFDSAFAEIDLDGSGTIDLREFCAWLGTQHYSEQAELLDVARAFEESASWFGKSDTELLELVETAAAAAAAEAAEAAEAAAAAEAETDGRGFENPNYVDVADEDLGMSPEELEDAALEALEMKEEETRAEAEAFATRMFHAADKNGDGTLTKSEVKSYCKKNPEDKSRIVGQQFTWKDFFGGMDVDGSGNFDIDEFTNAVVNSFLTQSV